MKFEYKFKTVILLLIGLIVFVGCVKEFNYGDTQNAVKTVSFKNIGQTTVDASGTVITNNGAALTAKGICYGTNNNPTIFDLKKLFTTTTLGDYTCTLDNLSPSTIYYVRAYATNSYGTAYGASLAFTTLEATTPVISTTTAANLVTATTANTGGIITNSGAYDVSSRGVCYSSSVKVPTVADAKTIDGTGVGTFISSLTGLAANTTYYIRAYATNQIGTAYGDVKSFNTTTATNPTGITTSSASAITQTTSTSGGNIINDGGGAITSRGVCWSNTTSTPTIFNQKTVDGSGAGSFISSLTGLLPGTTYYLRAYATNNIGTAYGDLKVFKTVSATTPTGITTNALSSVTQNAALGGGSITTDGGAAITSRGVCWSNTNASPTITNSKTIDGTGNGFFSSSLTGLLPGTTYYVRAYATNSVGTSYGPVKSFTTISATIPTGISTTNTSSVNQTVAISGGSISSDGGASITSKGVCWSSTTSTPTISNSYINSGTGIAAFSSSLSGLTANTTYYVRAYATNSIGTAYGNTLSFTTLPNLSVGQSYQGGVIAYIFVSTDNGFVTGEVHGLIATTSNQSTASQWGCSGVSIAGTSSALGSGMANTTAITKGCATTTIAAAICNNLSSGGYTDWYLPSYIELNKLYINKSAIGGFSNVSYWSSSQTSSTAAYSINFTNGTGSTTTTKTTSIYVRAIRKF